MIATQARPSLRTERRKEGLGGQRGEIVQNGLCNPGHFLSSTETRTSAEQHRDGALFARCAAIILDPPPWLPGPYPCQLKGWDWRVGRVPGSSLPMTVPGTDWAGMETGVNGRAVPPPCQLPQIRMPPAWGAPGDSTRRPPRCLRTVNLLTAGAWQTDPPRRLAFCRPNREKVAASELVASTHCHFDRAG